MKGYFINLDAATERRAHMESEALRCGLDLVRVGARDGRLLSEAEARAVCPGPGHIYQLSASEIGCFLSHRLAWSRIAASVDSHGAVFEDDVHFAPDAKQWLCVEEWIPADADIIKVETVGRAVLMRGPLKDVGAGRSLWRLTGLHFGGGGYILSRNCAQSLLQATETFRDPVDNVLFDPECGFFGERVALQLNPALCIQQVRTRTQFLPAGASVSTMKGTRGSRMDSGWRKVLREISRTFNKAGRTLMLHTRAIVSGQRYARVPFR